MPFAVEDEADSSVRFSRGGVARRIFTNPKREKFQWSELRRFETAKRFTRWGFMRVSIAAYFFTSPKRKRVNLFVMREASLFCANGRETDSLACASGL